MSLDLIYRCEDCAWTSRTFADMAEHERLQPGHWATGHMEPTPTKEVTR